MPEMSVEVKAYTYEDTRSFFEQFGGKSFPNEHVKQAQAEVEELCNILRHEGVTVRRPDIMNYTEVTVPKQGTDYHAIQTWCPSTNWGTVPRHGH